MTTEEFIDKALKIHGKRYDYSKVNYRNTDTKVCIICPEHGEFWQTPHMHIGSHRQGCKQCGLEKSLRMAKHGANSMASQKAAINFYERAKSIHGDRYDYSKIEYKNNYSKVCIICREHGEFWQTPVNHLTLKQGCPKCNGSDAKKLEGEKNFFIKSKEIHGNKYDYSKIEYKNRTTDVVIVCPEHGEFWQSPATHLQGCGCPKCNPIGNYQAKTKFVEKANITHNNRYDYSKADYKSAFIPVCIICPEHGEFWQKPAMHVYGHGCPICSESHGEREVAKILNELNIPYEREKSFGGLNGVGGCPLRFDFYISSLNLCIEFDGPQHHEWIQGFQTKKEFNNTQKHDRKKNEFCFENGISLFRITNVDAESFKSMISTIKTN